MPKLNVYTLGELGINRVKSPVHVEDGELLNAQNASVRPIQGQKAITKRDGMAKINAATAAGALVSITNIPIAASHCVTLFTQDEDWRAGAWSPTLGLFAVVGQSGTGNRVITSPDGITWTTRTSAADVDWNDIVWSPELAIFCAVGGLVGTAAQQVMTSSDGITWTSRTATSDRTWNGVAWSADLTLFAAVASSGAAAGMIMTSPDGVTWTARTSPAVRGWRRVVWADGLSLFVAVSETVGFSTQIMTSPDGITWTLRDTGITNNGYNEIAWSEELGLLVACGVSAMYSDDGINWSAATTFNSGSASISAVQWGADPGVFLHGADNGFVETTTDGDTWTSHSLNCDEVAVHEVVYSSSLGQFLLIGVDENGIPVMELTEL